MKTVLRYSAIPLALCAAFFAFAAVYRGAGLPSGQELIELASEAFDRQGLLVVFVAGLAEGLLVANWYLPGSVVIVLGVGLSGGEPTRAVLYVGLVVVAFVVTAIANYWLGRTAWYKFLLVLGLRKPLEQLRPRVEGRGALALYYTYFHPNVGAMVALSLGILRIPFWRFLFHATVSVLAWNTLWGLIAYNIGSDVLVRLLDMRFILPVLALWAVISVARGVYVVYSKRRQKG
jgi:membrane protein DedA with SNARE-associated domain